MNPGVASPDNVGAASPARGGSAAARRGVAAGEANGVSSSSVSEMLAAGDGGAVGKSLIWAKACRARARRWRTATLGGSGAVSAARSLGGPGCEASPTRRPLCG